MAVDNDLPTYWWKRATGREAAIRDHCDRVMQRCVDAWHEFAMLDRQEPESPRFEDIALWEAAGIDWQAVRERTKPSKVAS